MLRYDHITILRNPHVAPGIQVLSRGGKPVWMGPLDAPTEDVDCDTIVLHPRDFEHLMKWLRDHGRKL